MYETELATWQREQTFADDLYEWMQRAPWLAISATAHLVIFLIIQAIPWNLFEQVEEKSFTSTLQPPAPEEPEDPPPEEPEVPLENPDIEEPVLVESLDIVDSDDTESEYEELANSESTADLISPFDAFSDSREIGISGPPGGSKGGLRGGREKKRKGGVPVEEIEAALKWLAEHQDADGKWDCDEFMKHDPVGDQCTGPGQGQYDVGVTGLALLAFLGDGNRTNRGRYQDNVRRAVKWLRDQQDVETGLIGEAIGHHYVYDHAIATLALCEAYYVDRSPLLKPTCQRAVNLITRARTPYGAWRYDIPSMGDQDTSVTGWMIFALKSAEDAGLTIDREAYTGARNWFLEVTDPATGRVGYDTMGSMSARTKGLNDEFPVEGGEAMTATALLCRVFMGDDTEDPIMQKHADLLLRSLPEWDPDGFGCDMYYWYYGSYAMFQVGGRHWKAWNSAMRGAVRDSQRSDGSAKGSWDPVGPWGTPGGRVYSTAIMALNLQVYFRYSRLAGAR